MLEYLLENESFLAQFPTGAVQERRARWQPLAKLLAQAMAEPALAIDAQLEAHRVWAEERHHSALVAVTLCAHAGSAVMQQRFADDPEALEELRETLERDRVKALMVLSKEDLKKLRAEGFLRPGE